MLVEVTLAILHLSVHVEPKEFKSLTSASLSLVPDKYINRLKRRGPTFI